MFEFIGRAFGRSSPIQEAKSRQVSRNQVLRAQAYQALQEIRAKYNAAATDYENERHFTAADNLSARAANSPAVRQILRSRARFEAANNSYVLGIRETIANVTIGRGPRLQMSTGDSEFDEKIERVFAAWSRAVKMPIKLRTMRRSKMHDGEALAQIFSNPTIRTPETPLGKVTLDFRPIESDRLANPAGYAFDSTAVNGIEFDVYGNPTYYRILKYHPGDTSIEVGLSECERVPARYILHLFRNDRPEMERGIPEITAGLPIISQSRRYTRATLQAAETAAHLAAWLCTPAPPEGETGPDADMQPQAGDLLPIQFGVMGVAPAGFEPKQLHAEQPTTTYPDAKHEFLDEFGRGVGIPSNLARLNSSAYNYASGRLDNQVFYKGIDVDQSEWESEILDRLLVLWLEEAIAVQQIVLPSGIDFDLSDPPHEWFWDAQEHVDPSKEADATETELSCAAVTFPTVYARRGQDWRKEFAKQAEALGITVAEYQALVREHLLGGKSAAPTEKAALRRTVEAIFSSMLDDAPAGAGGNGNGNGNGHHAKTWRR